MSNSTQPSSDNMLSKLFTMANALLATAPPEIKEKIIRCLQGDSSHPASEPAAPSASKDECDCPICSLRKLLKADGQQVDEKYGFNIEISGILSKEVAEAVGGLNTGPESRDDLGNTMRAMSGVLIEEAKYQATDSEEKKILQASAVNNFTQGIRALNTLMTANAAAK